MYEINEFCRKRKITSRIQDAFVAYCKAFVHDSYHIGNGQTATGLLMKFTQDELEQRWKDFVNDLHDHITKEQVA